MLLADSLPAGRNVFDFIIVGGGTAGCVIASRLSEYLPNKTVLLIEGGPLDLGKEEVLVLQRCVDLIGTDLDYDYPIHEQEKGNSHIRMSRAKVLGGCSSHNDSVTLLTFAEDCRNWEQAGVRGWDHKTFVRLFEKLRTSIHTVKPHHRNPIHEDWVTASHRALGLPILEEMNETIKAQAVGRGGVGFLPVGYYPEDGRRSSASVNYIHPILLGKESRPNLTLLTDTWVKLINTDGKIVKGVDVRFKTGEEGTIQARQEVVLSAGAIDTPRLMMLSGIGPQAHLKSIGIEVKKDIPGVGENLMDHPETVIVWELNKEAPPDSVMDADAALFLRVKPINLSAGDTVADMQMHTYKLPLTIHTERLGYDSPPNSFTMMPNCTRPKSKGRLFLYSRDPQMKPALDFRYFTDAEGYDESIIVEGIKAARAIAKETPFKDWLKREVAPGPSVQTDEELMEYTRKAGGTVYHPAGTAKMGDLQKDSLAVVDSNLCVRGLKKLRVADASIFPTMTTVNPMATVLCVGERAAELVAAAAGWKPSKSLHL